MLSSITRLQVRSRALAVCSRSFVKVGDKVPVSYVKEIPDPLIKKDEEYPSWVLTLHEKLPTKRQLLDQIESQGIDSLTMREVKRTKRLITKEVIKQKNLLTLS